jgi:hypothetical protein
VRAEVNFTFTDVFNDFAVRTDIVGPGLTALYESLLETKSRRWGCAFGSDGQGSVRASGRRVSMPS